MVYGTGTVYWYCDVMVMNGTWYMVRTGRVVYLGVGQYQYQYPRHYGVPPCGRIHCTHTYPPPCISCIMHALLSLSLTIHGPAPDTGRTERHMRRYAHPPASLAASGSEDPPLSDTRRRAWRRAAA